jgi:cyclophilin family peptidyl-prolyl cis-trans isomerase
MSLKRFSEQLALITFVATLCAVCSPASARQADSSVTADTDTASTEATVRKGLCMKLDKGGVVIIELYPDKAPKTVERIMKLAGEGFYDGLKFHRVESFLVQTGKAEHDLPPLEGEMFGQRIWHEEGMVGMARLPNGYDTATTQFYIMKERMSKLNGEYTLFGRVLSGMEHVHGMKKGRKIESLTICDIE